VGGVAYEFGTFRLELTSRRLLRGGDVVALTGRAFDTLVSLVENSSRVVDKDELMRWVWPDAVVEESNLSQQIFLLRKILGEGPKDHRYIATVPRRGYRFVATVVRIEADASEPRPSVTPAAAYEVHAFAPMRLSLKLPAGAPIALGASSPFALSPDGRLLAYVAREAEGSWLRIRPIDRLESTRVERSEGASSPFFSPDGRWIGFFAKGRLFKVSTSGGAPTVLCEAGSECRGASWSTRDAIVFTPTPASNLSVVPADGGAPRPATTLDFAQGERDASLAGRAAQRAQRALHHRPSRFRVVRRG
jgi:DNA-binding winged helix-turn-helix (wHTH) protein